MFDINEFIKVFREEETLQCPHIICKDGFTISVQGSHYHYCYPRTDHPYYTEVEAGFPSEQEQLLDRYKDGNNDPLISVYSNVPIDVIHKIIEKHGGFCHVV
jgi:hypothetical protein